MDILLLFFYCSVNNIYPVFSKHQKCTKKQFFGFHGKYGKMCFFLVESIYTLLDVLIFFLVPRSVTFKFGMMRT